MRVCTYNETKGEGKTPCHRFQKTRTSGTRDKSGAERRRIVGSISYGLWLRSSLVNDEGDTGPAA